METFSPKLLIEEKLLLCQCSQRHSVIHFREGVSSACKARKHKPSLSLMIKTYLYGNQRQTFLILIDM